MTFVEVYRPHVEYGSISAGKFPAEHAFEETHGLRVFDRKGAWAGDEYNPPRALYFFPWYAIARLEYSEGEA